jgi:hypothetical protein
MEHREEPFVVGIAIKCFGAVVFAVGARGVIGRAASALATDRQREGMVLRSGGRSDVDHEVSILSSPSEESREARPRSNVSTTIMRPPQLGHGCARTRG